MSPRGKSAPGISPWESLRAPGARRAPGAPAVEIDAPASVPAATVWAASAGCGVVATLMCAWAGAGAFALVALAALLVAMLALPRTVLPAGWLAVVGYVLLTTDGALGPLRPLWVIVTIASVHAALAGARLVQSLTPLSRIGLSVLRVRTQTLWRPQVIAQAIGVLAWWPLRTQQPWLTVVALAALVSLALVLLRRSR